MQSSLDHSLLYLPMHETEILQLDMPGPYEGRHWRDNTGFGAQEDFSPDVQLKHECS